MEKQTKILIITILIMALIFTLMICLKTEKIKTDCYDGRGNIKVDENCVKYVPINQPLYNSYMIIEIILFISLIIYIINT